MPTKFISKKGRAVKQKNNWKSVQSKARIKQKSKIALIILSFIIGLLVLSWAVRFTKTLFHPWGVSDSTAKSYTWNGEFNINLLIKASDIALLSYNPKEEKIVLIHVPDETFLDVPFGFGLWQLRSVYGLGQTQKGLGGDKLLKDTLTSFFALPVDGFLDLSDQGQKSSEFLDTIRKNPLSGLNLMSKLRTDLTLMELLKLKTSLSAVRFDKIEELDLVNLNVVDKENLPDGTQIFTADPVRLDSVLSDLSDPTIVSEHKTIAIFNATDHPQLAFKWARLITNLGGNVIITANAKIRLNKTQVIGEKSLTLKRLQQIFALDCFDNPKCGKISEVNEDLVSSRAQINVFLGEDYFNR